MTHGTKSGELLVDEFSWRPGLWRVDAVRASKETFMFPINRYRLVVVFAALFLSVGCASTSPTPDLGVQEEPKPVVETSKSNTIAPRPVPVTLEPVYFDTDQAVLRLATLDQLKGYAQSILDYPEWGLVTIDGHCDERGSDEHNRALGRRRAAAVERYLVEMGVPPERVSIRTFGSDKPAVLGHDEGSWRHNRRSELQVEVRISSSF
ncbi:MAG: OmpA family protein [Deltaproteobacteria bacterium]|nr:OmpA family protein [Deltaproteobacteria bacterium]